MAERWLWTLVPWRGGWNPRSKAPGQGSVAWVHGSVEEYIEYKLYKEY